ncbi:MAG TPA: PKD domain-containing protein [Candidatus Thermoplasmatota archaeon]
MSIAPVRACGSPRASPPHRTLLWAGPWTGVLVSALALLVAPASAETVITETSTTFLYSLDASGSPYILSHDFSVLPGGTLFVGPGAELQVESGAVLRGVGGDISVHGTLAAPAVVRARPGAPAGAWAGIDLGSGSELSVRFGVLHNGTPAVSAQAGSAVTMDGAAVGGCATWCLRVFGEANVTLANASFADGSWGYRDGASRGARGVNLSFVNFSVAAIALYAPSYGASFQGVQVASGPAGVIAEGVANVDFGRLEVAASTGAALAGSMSADLRVHNSSLESASGVSVDLDQPVRFRLEASVVSGGAGALRIGGATAPVLLSNRLSSADGACLELPGAVAAVLEGNALDGCARPLSVPRGTAPPQATAGPSNTVAGKPFLWVEGGSGLAFGANGTGGWGLVALFRVDGAVVSDIELSGTGVYLFGCTDITMERLHVYSAEVGVTAVGSRGVRVVAYRAEDVGRALDAWNDTAFPLPLADFVVERARVERAADAAFRFEAGTNLTLRWTLVEGAGVAARFEGASGVLVANVLVRGAGTGVWASNSTDVTVVDSSFEGASAVGLLAESTTGVAARNAFVSNAQHASAPSSPSFAFNELLAGNYWSNWSAPDANNDGWADIPYNLSDGTGVDYRPRVVRWDFHPTALAAAAPVAELGVPATLDGSPSFDDFAIQEFYWEVRAPGDNATSQGPAFPWTPNATGPHVVRLSVVGSFGASDEYTFPVLVVDSRPPSFGFGPIGRPEAGVNLTVALEASDNDPAFPSGARVEWVLTASAGPSRRGNATGLTFEVPVTRVGPHTLSVTLFDAAGNARTGSVALDVGDTVPPEIAIAYDGQPDLGLPFSLDAAATFDPSGVDAASARWTWVEAGVSRTLESFPVAEVTFEHAGNYTVTLRVCDGLGNCGQADVSLNAADTRGPRLVRIHVVVPQREAVDIVPGQAPVVGARAGEEVVFEAFAEDASGNVTFLWDFGDGTTGEGARVVHRWAAPGEHTVVVTMADPLGNTNPAAVRMRIEPGGGLFGEIIPGVSGDLVVLVLAVAGASAAAFLALRRVRRPRVGEPPAR